MNPAVNYAASSLDLIISFKLWSLFSKPEWNSFPDIIPWISLFLSFNCRLNVLTWFGMETHFSLGHKHRHPRQRISCHMFPGSNDHVVSVCLHIQFLERRRPKRREEGLSWSWYLLVDSDSEVLTELISIHSNLLDKTVFGCQSNELTIIKSG